MKTMTISFFLSKSNKVRKEPEEMRGEMVMPRNILNMKQLIEQNKKELENDYKALEKIEKRLDSKYLKVKA